MLVRKFIRLTAYQIEPIFQVNYLWTALFLISTINQILAASGTANLRSNTSYQTAYACEGKTLEIKCPKDTLIHLIRANYGRYSISICNEQGNLDWKVDCTSPSSYSVISKRCSHQVNCSINVSSQVFEDHCPSTFKYLEVQYDCMVSAYVFNTSIGSSLDNNKSGSNSKSISNQKTNNFTLKHPITQKPFIKQQLTTRHPIIVPLIKLTPDSNAKDQLITPSSSLTPTLPNVFNENFKDVKKDEINKIKNISTSSLTTLIMPISQNTTTATSFEKVSTTSLKPPYLLPSNYSSYVPEINEQDKQYSTTKTLNNNNLNNKTESRNDFTSTNLVTFSPSVFTFENNKPTFSANKPFKSTIVATYLNDHHVTQEGDIFCHQVTFRGLTWLSTKPGSQSVVQCPPPYYGFAVWECDSNGNWKEARPDMTRCQSPWLNNLNLRLENGDSISSIASKLALKSRQLLIGSVSMFGGDIIKTVKLLQDLVHQMSINIENIQKDQRHHLAKEFGQSVIEVTGNLLDDQNYEAWLDLNVGFHSSKNDLKRQLSLQLIQIVESVGMILSTTQSLSYHYNRAHENLLFSVRLIDKSTSEINEMMLPKYDMLQKSIWKKDQDVIILPLKSSFNFDQVSTNSKKILKLVFLIFRNIGKFLTPNEFKSRKVINSNVITLSFVESNRNLKVNLAKPINIYFKHIQEANVSQPKCVFWNTSLSDWSSEGCWIISTNKSHTGCACNHLTTWALLMDINDEQQMMVQQLSKILALICVSCILSMIIIFVTFALLIVSRVSNIRQTIYKNLCVILFLAEIILCTITFQPWMQSDSFQCTITSWFIHFIIQSVFNLILIDSIIAYCCALNCDKIDKFISKNHILLYLASYGIPLLSIGITYLVSPNLLILSSLQKFCFFDAKFQEFFSIWLFFPTFLSIACTLLLIFLTSFEKLNQSPIGAHLKMKSSQSLNTNHCWKSVFLILLLQFVYWTVIQIFIHNPLTLSTTPILSIFFLTNLFQAIGLFIISFAKNDRVKNSICKSLSSIGWLPNFVKSTNAEPNVRPPAPSLAAYFYSLNPSHLISPPSPIIKLTPSTSSTSSTSSSRHQICAHNTSKEILVRNTLSNSKYIPEVNPYAPPVSIPIHEYEDIPQNSSEINYGFSQQRLQPNFYYYHATRSPIYYSERKLNKDFDLNH